MSNESGASSPSDGTPLRDVFQQSPTRELEEVQKVNARARAENDVREFYETDSAESVLTTLGEVVDRHPNEGPRFLYISATFGSGKTHLLKLVGFAADTESEFADLGGELANRWPGFRRFRESVVGSHVDRLKPVFLNLLNRDAAKEPPLPYLVYEAIGRELGYPTDPNWLLEWAWRMDFEHGDLWDQLCDVEHDGRTFEDVLDERASLRSWLYEAVPELDGVAGTPYDTSAGVKETIEQAIEEVAPESFEPEDLVDRVEEAQAALSAGGTETELLLGLDEVALFIGDGPRRYREFQETMTALVEGPNPPVVGTGQYSIERIHGEFEKTDVAGEGWFGHQEPLAGADTETIVRKRWLQKADSDGADVVRDAVERLPDLDLETYGDLAVADPDPVESYPFREYDLWLLRRVIQHLMPQGRVTEEEYVQGRALLILVRSLFTRFGWGDRPVGELVTWDDLFDLLVAETTYVPLWVQELVEDKLVPNAEAGADAATVRVAKALYLANQVRADVPSTPDNLARLMVDSVDASLSEVQSEVEAALDELLADRKVLTETNERGDEEYLLVSEDQEDVLSRASTRAEQLSSHRVSARLETLLRESGDLLLADGSRHVVDLDGERRVPLRFAYSVLDTVEKAPTPEFDAVQVRLAANFPDHVDEAVETWQSTNEGREGGEHVLVAVAVSESIEDRLREAMGMAEVLEEETDSYADLEADLAEEERALESTVRDQLNDAAVHVRGGGSRGDFEQVFEDVLADEVHSVFEGTRHVLSKGITEVDDARAMAQFFRGVGDWPLTEADAAMLGVDTDAAELTDGWCREFLAEYDNRPSLSGESLLEQTVQRGGEYRGTPRESIAALLITLATANEIALKRDDEYVTEPADIGRAVRTRTNLAGVQIRFESVEVDLDRIREVVEVLTGEPPEGSDPDAWLAELREWVADNSVVVKRVFRGVRREFDETATVDALEEALQPALDGEDLEKEPFGTDEVEEQARRFARARALFEPGADGTLWERFEDRAATMRRLYPGADVTGEMLSVASAGDVPDAGKVRGLLEDADEERRAVLREQYERITGETTEETEPDAIARSVSTQLMIHDSSTYDLANAVTMAFEGVDIDDLYALFEAGWDGDSFEEADLAEPAIRQQVERFARARRLLDEDEDGTSLWSRLEDDAERLGEEYPDHPVTMDVQDALARSRPPDVEEVERLLEEADKPFDLVEKLRELGEELEEEYPDDEVTEEVVAAAADPPEAERVAELIEEAQQVLAETGERLRRIQEQLDEVEEGSIVVVASGD